MVNKLEALLTDDTRVIIYDRRVYSTGHRCPGTEGIKRQSYLFKNILLLILSIFCFGQRAVHQIRTLANPFFELSLQGRGLSIKILWIG
jgi:hypothetical protein